MLRQKRALVLPLVVLCFFMAFYCLTGSGHISNGDGEAMYRVACSLIERGWFDITPLPAAQDITPQGAGEPIEYGAVGSDGRYYAKYGLGTSLAMAPLCALGRVVATAWPSDLSPYHPRLFVSFLNSGITAIACLVLYVWARRLRWSAKTAFLLTLAFGLGLAWPYSKTSTSEPLATLCLLVATYSAFQSCHGRGRRWLALSGLALGAAVLTRITMLVALPPLLLYLGHGWRAGRRQTPGLPWKDLAALAVPLLLTLAAVAWYNQVRFGSPLNTGYNTDNWRTPVWLGLYGLLFSPGKGLLWFVPLAWLTPLALRRWGRQHRPEAWLFVGLVATWIALHSIYTYWEGGWCWGPRLLFPILPYLILPLGSLVENLRICDIRHRHWQEAALGLLLALTIIVQIPAVLASPVRHYQREYNAHPAGFYDRTAFTLAGSQLLGQWQSLLEVGGILRRPEVMAQVQSHVQAILLEDTDPESALVKAMDVLSLNAPALWFVCLDLLGGHWLAGGMAAFLTCLVVIGALKWAMAAAER